MPRISLNGNDFSPVQIVPAVSTPGAGANLSFTVPNGAGFILESLSCILTTDATVANRLVRFRISRGGTQIAVFVAPGVQAASIVTTLIFHKGIPINTQTTTSTLGVLPVLPVMLPGDVLTSFVLNFQAGDTITVPIILLSSV